MSKFRGVELMRILVDEDLIKEYFLNRNNNIFPYAENLWIIISHSSNVKAYMTNRCLRNICDPEHMTSPKDAEVFAARLKDIFTICRSSPEIFRNARQYNSKIEPAIEIECGIKMGIDAIVTQEPQKYTTDRLQIYSVESFIFRHELNNNLYSPNNLFTSSSYSILSNNQQLQLSLPLVVNQSPLKYMIRNTFPIVMKALKILKSKGFRGLTKEELATKLERSEKTTQSIIWDLTKLKMAFNSGGRVSINPHLLDTGDSDVSEYLSIVLKDHAIVQEIYKEIETSKSITKWRLKNIIITIYSRDKYTKRKSKSNYSFIIISWLVFAKVIEERRNGIFSIPSSKSFLNIDYQNHSYEQLDLFQYQ